MHDFSKIDSLLEGLNDLVNRNEHWAGVRGSVSILKERIKDISSGLYRKNKTEVVKEVGPILMAIGNLLDSVREREKAEKVWRTAEEIMVRTPIFPAQPVKTPPIVQGIPQKDQKVVFTK